jgi:molybdenum cofactor biosynthesis protein B
LSEVKFLPIDCCVITVSDTRTLDTDNSGTHLVQELEAMGHRVAQRFIIKDDTDSVIETVSQCIADEHIVAVILTGGTGITRRDITPDAVATLSTKHIPGFGELFRMLSYQEIGSSTIQSRADAWLCQDTLVFVLPGSTGAVRLGFDKILKEQLDVRTRPCNFIQLLDRIRFVKTVDPSRADTSESSGG